MKAKLMSTKVVAGPIIASTAFVMELTLLPLLLPQIQETFGLGVGELTWVFNAYALAVAISVLAGGWIGDMFGARRVFTLGVTLFAAGAIMVSLSQSVGMLLTGRIVQGIGGGLFSPLVPVLLTSALPDKPGKILIIWGSIAGFVAAFAPLIGGTIVGTTGWQPIFSIFALLAALSLILIFIQERHRMETRRAGPREYRKLIQSRDLFVIYGYVFVTYGCISFFLFRIPLHLSAAEFPAHFIGIVVALFWLSFSMMGTLLRNAVDSARLRLIMISAPLLIALGFILAFTNNASLVYMLAAALVGAGFACSNAPSTQLVLGYAPKGLRAFATSLDITFARMGGVVAVTVFARARWDYMVAGICLLSVIAVACAWHIFRVNRRSECLQ